MSISQKSNEIKTVKVLLPLPVAVPFDYLLPEGGHVHEGSLVRVPVGKKEYIGAVWSAGDDTAFTADMGRLKVILEVLPLPPLPQGLMRFVAWVAAYTMTPLGSVLRMCLPPSVAGQVAPIRILYCRPEGASMPEGLTKTRQKVWASATSAPQSVAEFAEKAGVSQAVVRAMISLGHLRGVEVSMDAPMPEPKLGLEGPHLSGEQAVAATAFQEAARKAAYDVFLLHGVTGSGKTEVYFEGLHAALKTNKAQVLVLVPEIALTAQWLSRFEARFGVEPLVWHSDIGPAARRRGWHAVADGSARVVVGARSALFLPFQHLQFIVVDEEHDPSYKQEEGVLYQARDMAVLRAKLADCPVVLASATPSLETLVNAENGKYKTLTLKERHGRAVLPDMRAIDMRVSPPPAGAWLSPTLTDAMRATLNEGEQVMLFLNRRGYAPLTLCRTCGHRFECEHCAAWLVEHRFRREMQCHQCGFARPLPTTCPQCQNTDCLAACGPGVERVFEEATSLFPDARSAVLTSDTVASPQKMQAMIGQIERGHIDIIIGTQLITKGYHFPKLTLVGVVDADLGLRGGDLRAGERTYQQLVQVAGRAGRAEKPGTVFLQTFEPEHPVMAALMSGDSETFMAAEQTARQQYAMPPFGQMVAFILSGRELAPVLTYARALAAKAPLSDDVRVLGPVVAPLAKVRGLHRVRILVHARRRNILQKMIADWLAVCPAPNNVRLRVDVDPYSFL